MIKTVNLRFSQNHNIYIRRIAYTGGSKMTIKLAPLKSLIRVFVLPV